MSRWLAIGLTGGSLLWLVALVAAPFGVSDGSLGAWLVYQAAGAICHQRPDRSLHLAGAQMPVCARCFGLYFSGAAGALTAWLVGPTGSRPTWESRAVLGMAALPTLVTFSAEWLGLAAPSSSVRALAALPLGASAGWLLVRLLRTDAHSIPVNGRLAGRWGIPDSGARWGGGRPASAKAPSARRSASREGGGVGHSPDGL